MDASLGTAHSHSQMHDQQAPPQMQAESARRWSPARLAYDPVTRAVFAIGLVEIIAWGTTFYALGGFGQHIATATGWSRTIVFGGMTVGLLTAALVSTTAGRMVDRHGGRRMMALGCILAAAGLAAAAASASPALYLLAWVVIGFAMRLTLYDAAFAALVQIDPSRGRRAISYLTLFGGLASTVFWPIGHALAGAWGWRETCLAFAAVNLLVALPLVLVGLPRRPRAPTANVAAPANLAQSAPTGAAPLLDKSHHRAAMLMFTAVVAGNSYVFGSMSAHLLTVLQGVGLATGIAVTYAALKGVAQVLGRLGEIVFGANLPALDLARISVAILPLAFAFLMLGRTNIATALVFTILFGVSNGLITIVRGALPLVLFGAEGYGALLGALAAPQLAVIALSPTAFVALTDAWGFEAGLWSLLAAAAVSLLAMELMAHWARERSAPPRAR